MMAQVYHMMMDSRLEKPLRQLTDRLLGTYSKVDFSLKIKILILILSLTHGLFRVNVHLMIDIDLFEYRFVFIDESI